MGQTRDCQTRMNLEPTFHSLLRKQAHALGMTDSAYVRRLVIQELLRLKLVDANIMTNVTTMSPREISTIVSAASIAV